MREIPLSLGRVTVVDDEDYARVTAVGAWTLSKCGGKEYARHSYRDQFGISRQIALHTFLTRWRLVDHINGDGLDNRRSNLRCATAAQNAGNARTPTHNSSGFKGVSFYRRTGRWRAYIGGGTAIEHLGYFATAEEAAHAYDVAATARWGEFARLNFPMEDIAS